MSKEHPDTGLLKRWVVREYLEQSGSEIQPEAATDDQLKQFVHWLGFQEAESGSGSFIRKWPRLDFILHSDYSTKINSISQRHCNICGRSTPWGRFVIRITPISRQAASSKKGLFAAFQAAFVERFADRPLEVDTSGALCLALTFVLNEKKHDRDVDNMSKALLDAFARSIGFNDRFVHHLDVVKLIFRVNEEYVYVRVMPSSVNRHDDVLAPTTHHTWLGVQHIDLASYLPTPPVQG